MKAPKYVIAPEGCLEYLTPGKRYETIRPVPDSAYGFFFCILNDENLSTSCSLYRCPHLNGGDWIIPDDTESVPVDDERRFIAACHAMQGILASKMAIPSKSSVIEASVSYADALLAALKGDRHD